MARSEVERAHFGMWGGSFKEPSRYRACRVVSERIPDAWGVIDAAAKQTPAKVRVEGLKWILAGTPIEQNSLQRKAYSNQPGWRGRSNFTDAQLREILELALERPTQLALHVVGDEEERIGGVGVAGVVGRHAVTRVVGEERQPLVELPGVEERGLVVEEVFDFLARDHGSPIIASSRKRRG